MICCFFWLEKLLSQCELLWVGLNLVYVANVATSMTQPKNRTLSAKRYFMFLQFLCRFWKTFSLSVGSGQDDSNVIHTLYTHYLKGEVSQNNSKILETQVLKNKRQTCCLSLPSRMTHRSVFYQQDNMVFQCFPKCLQIVSAIKLLYVRHG